MPRYGLGGKLPRPLVLLSLSIHARSWPPGRSGPVLATLQALPESHDLDPFLQRRRLDLYEQAVARQGYAYGVDVRRSRWLARSSLGNAAVRVVDRAWSKLSQRLSEEVLQDPNEGIHPAILAELAAFKTLLRAPRPALLLLKPEASADGSWPAITALGPARGGARWLVLDPVALEAMDVRERRFWLASGLAHLQCGHGVFYTAHLLLKMGEAPRGIAMLRRVLTPWSRVMAFSADRAGLLASVSLDDGLYALEKLSARESEVPWLPRPPTLDMRRVALDEFERSIVVARIRAARINRAQSVSVVEERNEKPAHGKKRDAKEDATKAADEEQAPTLDEPPRAAKLPQSANEGPSTEPATDPSDEAQVAHVPENAWSIARCDRRLTERLGLL